MWPSSLPFYLALELAIDQIGVTMENTDKLKEELEQVLSQVTDRLRILDMIEERLLHMRTLTQRVINEMLTQGEIEAINKQVKDLAQQINLLEGETDGYKH